MMHFNTNNGLPHDITYGLFQDSSGYIWIGTDSGLVKFDGHQFKIYTSNDALSSNFIIAINELSNKNLAIATWRGGLNIFNPYTEEIIYYLEGPKKLSNIEIFRDTLYNYHDYRNNVFWADDDEIRHKKIVYSPNESNRLKEFDISRTDLSSAEFKVIEDSLYLFSSRKYRQPLKGIYIQRGNEKVLKFPFLEHKIITSLNKVNKDVFIAGHENEAILFNQDKILESFHLDTGNTRILKVETQGDYAYLMNADDKGFMQLFSFNLKTKHKKNLAEVYGIKSTISDFMFDHESNLWISSFGDGLYCIFPEDTAVKNIPLNKNIVDIAFLDNKAFLLSNRNVFAIEDYALTDSIALQGFGKHIIRFKDSIIISSLEINSNSLGENIWEHYGYRRFYLEKHGSIVISNKIEFKDLSKHCGYDKLRYNVFDAFELSDNLFFCTNDGLYRYHEDANKIEKHLTSNKALDNSIINTSIQKKDSIFLGTNTGLWAFSGNKSDLISQDGDLINQQINALFLDHDDKIWIGTQSGASIFHNGAYRNLTQESGLLSSYVSKIKEDGNNNIWITGNKGVSIIKNNGTLTKTNPPILNITQKDNRFYYSSISFNRTKLINQYQLNDEAWTNLDNRSGVLDFSNYKKGDYTLKLRSKKLDSDWAISRKYIFAITIPWYKEMWVLFFLSAVVASAIILFILKRLKQSKLKTKQLQSAIKKREALEKELVAVRHNIAQDFHDDLGNKLARISILSSLLEGESKSLYPENKELLSQISTDADYLYKGTKDFIFTLKNKSDYLEEVATYISDFGEDYLKQFNIVFEVEKQITSNVKLPYYWSKQIIYIFKEALTNIAKHAQCEKVDLTFEYNSTDLKICCKDDGKGFKFEQVRNKGGLQHIEERAISIGCDLTIDSNENGYGTKIVFRGKPH
ncbi:sensor histidine kinase [Hyunsoonleella rubra]|uniref:histidine kinase n=1 Tax=Hyunsoonleella rubra TaxID=1737062 RepID=A0ABW5TEB0_9FLAO